MQDAAIAREELQHFTVAAFEVHSAGLLGPTVRQELLGGDAAALGISEAQVVSPWLAGAMVDMISAE